MTKALHFYELMMIVVREAIELERARIQQETSSFWATDCDRAANFGF